MTGSNEQKQAWKVGDIYYQAEGYYNGHQPADIDAKPRRSFEEAEQDTSTWLFWLSGRERANAVTYVRTYRVLAVDGEGNISQAESI